MLKETQNFLWLESEKAPIREEYILLLIFL